MEKEDCDVCYEGLAKPVTCPYCKYTTCLTCTKKYLLTQPLQPHCMQCKTGWSLKDQHKLLPRAWLNSTGKDGYRAQKKRLLLDMQKARLQEYAIYIDATVNVQIAQQVELKRAQAVASRRGSVLYILSAELCEIEIKILECVNEEVLKVLKLERKAKNGEVLAVRGNWAPPRVAQKAGPPIKPKICFKCTADSCNGFVKTSGACIICEAKHCTKCGIQKEKGHVCDPETVETLKLIRSTTKLCPNPLCAERIAKFGGCDQMWCTACKTAFSWSTGEMGLDAVHNPHYRAWRYGEGDVPRELGDIPCGGFQGHVGYGGIAAWAPPWFRDELGKRKLVDLSICSAPTITSFLNLFGNIDMILRKTRYQEDEKLRDLGVKYLRGISTEKQWENGVFRVYGVVNRRGAVDSVFRGMRDASVESYNTATRLTQKGYADPNAARISNGKVALKQLIGILEIFTGFLAEELAPFSMKSPPSLGYDEHGRFYWTGTLTPAKKDQVVLTRAERFHLARWNA